MPCKDPEGDRESHRKGQRRRYAANPEPFRAKARESMRKWRTQHPEASRASVKTWRDENRERWRLMRQGIMRRYRAKHPEAEHMLRLNGHHRRKLKVLVAYGGTPPRCACCSETFLGVLTIDHIGGGGAAHRKEIGANKFYSWLIRQGFPAGFRVLCFNCNIAVHRGRGVCGCDRSTLTPAVQETA